MSATEAAAVTEEELERLSDWLAAANGARQPLRLSRTLSGGTQNLLVVVETEAGRYVVRRPRRGAGRRQGETIVREARMLRALESTDVPRAAFVGAGETGEVFADGPFLVTELVPGFNAAMELPEPHATDADLRAAMAHSAVRALSLVANVDLTSADFAFLDSATHFIPREQVRRFAELFASYRDVPGYRPDGLHQVDTIADWLQRHAPAEVEHGLVHGDFHYGNLLFDRSGADVAAIVDWELARFGAPLADLGWFLISIPTEPRSVERHPLIRAGGHPTRDDLVSTYAEASGRRVDDIKWFTVFAALKMGAILEGTAARAAAGQASPKTGAFLHNMTVQLLGRAADIIEGSSRGF